MKTVSGSKLNVSSRQVYADTAVFAFDVEVGISCKPLGPHLSTDKILKGTEGKAKELQDDLHFEEAGIKVEEQCFSSTPWGRLAYV